MLQKSTTKYHAPTSSSFTSASASASPPPPPPPPSSADRSMKSWDLHENKYSNHVSAHDTKGNQPKSFKHLQELDRPPSKRFLQENKHSSNHVYQEQSEDDHHVADTKGNYHDFISSSESFKHRQEVVEQPAVQLQEDGNLPQTKKPSFSTYKSQASKEECGKNYEAPSNSERPDDDHRKGGIPGQDSPKNIQQRQSQEMPPCKIEDHLKVPYARQNNHGDQQLNNTSQNKQNQDPSTSPVLKFPDKLEDHPSPPSSVVRSRRKSCCSCCSDCNIL